MNGITLIIGNLCTILGMAANAFSAARKTTKGVLRVQNLSQCFYGAGSIVLKISFLFSVLAFAVFNAAIFNFAGAISDLVVVITTITVLVKSAKKDRKA